MAGALEELAPLLDADLEPTTIGAVTLRLVASSFGGFGSQLMALDTDEEAGDGDWDQLARAFAQVQCELQRLGDSRGVALPWLPIEVASDTAKRRTLRLLGGCVEALTYLSRRPEFG